jgi:hypothetical protein
MDDFNLRVLGYDMSFLRKNPQALKDAKNHVSVSMDVPLWVGHGYRNVTILSVYAPALCDDKTPAWNVYVNNKGVLDSQTYKNAFSSMADQIIACACLPNNNGKRVVLSAVGMGNFVEGLGNKQKERAQKIAASQFAKCIRDLRHKGVDVAYTDTEEKSEFWNKVNSLLKARKGPPIEYAGKVPGEWITDRDIIVNANDPSQMAGYPDGLGIDGALGRNSPMHAVHAMAAILFSEGLFPVPGWAPPQSN